MEIKPGSRELLFTTIRIETHTDAGTGSGTGFVFAYPDTVSPEKHHLYLVTNKHVVEGAKDIHFFLTLGDENFPAEDGSALCQKPVIGSRVNIDYEQCEALWHGHPDPNVDITVMPMSPLLTSLADQGGRVFLRSIPITMIPSTAQLEELDAIEQVVFIGYPNGVYDTLHLLPIVRTGTTATPLYLPYCGEPIFLIDASVFPGSSGSPVFIYNSVISMRDQQVEVSNRAYFIGVIARVLHRTETGTIDFVSIPTLDVPVVFTPQMIDLGLAFKASTVVTAIEDQMAKHRRKS